MTSLLNGPVMMSSLEICEVIANLAKDSETGVVAKEHKHILRDIREQLKISGPVLDSIKTDSYIIEVVTTLKGLETKQICLNQEETEVLITGYSVPIRRAVLQAYKKKIADLEKKNIPSYQIEDEVERALKWAEERKEMQKALAQAEYQDRALTTSQVRNGLLTKTVKKLKNELKGYAEFVSLNSFLSLNKISTYDPVQKGRQSTKSIVTKLKKMGLENDAWTLKTFEDDEFPTTAFDPDFLAGHIEFILSEIERLIKGKRQEQEST